MPITFADLEAKGKLDLERSRKALYTNVNYEIMR
jgi:hypothetical protein